MASSAKPISDHTLSSLPVSDGKGSNGIYKIIRNQEKNITLLLIDCRGS